MKQRKICSGSKCFHSNRKKELKFFSFPMNTVQYVCLIHARFVMFTDELFLGFEAICSTLTGLWYGPKKMGYPVLLILLE
jgi:hypothetical protein